jgi:mono/diheme cytochrome c family protein
MSWAATGKILLALLVLAIAASLAAIGIVIQHGVSARAQPTAMESMLARSVRYLAVPRAARTLRNPLPLTPQVLQEGRDHFADHCSSCHANDGSGKTDMGPNFYPLVPDMREPRTQQLSDGQIFSIIRNGVRLTGMPAWGGEHDEEENWKLVHFIRHLPKITPAEIEAMKRMNPISPHELEEQKENERFLEGVPKNENEHH